RIPQLSRRLLVELHAHHAAADLDGAVVPLAAAVARAPQPLAELHAGEPPLVDLQRLYVAGARRQGAEQVLPLDLLRHLVAGGGVPLVRRRERLRDALQRREKRRRRSREPGPRQLPEQRLPPRPRPTCE